MTTGTAVEVRATLDLTRAPSEQWNAEMVATVAKNVFRGKAITQPQLYYCLSVAESLGLNPMIGEVYFLPSKSKDGAGPAWSPYIGRNGLVVKAAERGAYYESDTVHANDKFSMRRTRDGQVAVTHSYGSADRGEIVGAYAFLHFRNGDRPAFFYAKLSEYLPTFDQDWKMKASPWGNQRSAMIEKCAMIGAGRKRLNLGNVLIDAEGAIVEQMGSTGPRSVLAQEGDELDFAQFTDDPELAERLRLAAAGAGWPAAKSEMVMAACSHDELEQIAAAIEREAMNRGASEHVAAAGATPEVPADDPSPEPDGTAEGRRMADEAAAADLAEAELERMADEVVTDAQVVEPEEQERVEALMARAARLEQQMMGAADASDEQAAYSAELDLVQAELDALSNPDQTSFGL